MYFIEEIIRTILLLISSVLILISSIGILRLNDKLDNVIYARIHILGVIDIACILAFIALGQPILAAIYFVIAPFLAHAMANAFYHGEYIKKIADDSYGDDDCEADDIYDNYNDIKQFKEISE